jgi:hypothetical protein
LMTMHVKLLMLETYRKVKGQSATPVMTVEEEYTCATYDFPSPVGCRGCLSLVG